MRGNIAVKQHISIHALRGEGDSWRFLPTLARLSFLSTPSVGRATEAQRVSYNLSQISIHALRGEGDAATARKGATWAYFYPRPPWGGRPVKSGSAFFVANFYPRPPWGGRLRFIGGRPQVVDFYPRPPWGGRRVLNPPDETKPEISIHALRGEGDHDFFTHWMPLPISIHALRGEGDYLVRCQ